MIWCWKDSPSRIPWVKIRNKMPDKRHNKKLPPKAPSNLWAVLTEELLAFWSFLASHWRYILPGIALVIALLYVARPLPPRTLTIATGQPHSTADVVGHQYQAFFRTHGIDLQLVPSLGAEDNLQLLARGKVDAAFGQGGLPLEEGSSHVLSLGSIAYQPLWLFYYEAERNEPDLNALLTSRRTSINVPGSSTRLLANQVLDAHGIDLSRPTLMALNTSESVRAFRDKKIDAIFLVGSMESENIREIAKLPKVRVYNFRLAEAYAKRFQYLDPVLLPTGALSFHPVSPSNDVHMIATTLDILVTDKLHPALQLLFLEATADFDRKRLSFFSQGKFPAYMDTRIPESDVARRFFKEGSPIFWGYAPFWAASLFDEVWFYLLAIGAIVIPLVSFLPSYRKTHAGLSIESCYDELRIIENQIAYPEGEPDVAYAELLDRIDRLAEKARRLWVPTGNRNAYYDLRAAIHIVRSDILEQQANAGQKASLA